MYNQALSLIIAAYQKIMSVLDPQNIEPRVSKTPYKKNQTKEILTCQAAWCPGIGSVLRGELFSPSEKNIDLAIAVQIFRWTIRKDSFCRELYKHRKTFKFIAIKRWSSFTHVIKIIMGWAKTGIAGKHEIDNYRALIVNKNSANQSLKQVESKLATGDANRTNSVSVRCSDMSVLVLVVLDVIKITELTQGG